MSKSGIAQNRTGTQSEPALAHLASLQVNMKKSVAIAKILALKRRFLKAEARIAKAEKREKYLKAKFKKLRHAERIKTTKRFALAVLLECAKQDFSCLECVVKDIKRLHQWDKEASKEEKKQANR